MAVAQVVGGTYEVESGTISSNASGTKTGTLVTASVPVVAGEVLVLWLTTGTTTCTPSSTPTDTGTAAVGVTWTQRVSRVVASTTPIYCWTATVAVTGNLVVTVPYSYTSTTGSTAAWAVLERYTGAVEPTGGVASTTAFTTTSATGGATWTVTQAAEGAMLSWIAADWNGRITGTATASAGNTLGQNYLMPTAGVLAAWTGRMGPAAAGTKTVGIASWSAGTGVRKMMVGAVELAPAPTEPAWALAMTGGTTTWTADFTAGDAVAAGYNDAPWNRQAAAGNDAASGLLWPPPTDVAPYGRPGRALRFRVGDGDRRYEVEPSVPQWADGDARWVGFAFCYEPDTNLLASGYQAIWQLRPADSTGSPPIEIDLRHGALELSGGYGRPGAAAPGDYNFPVRVLVSPIVACRWYHVVMFVGVWSDVNSGRVDVWVDGVKVLDAFVPPPGTNWPTAPKTSYPKNGIYHDPVNRGATVWFADHRQGTSYDAVDPTQPIAAWGDDTGF